MVDYRTYITIDPNVRFGKPCIKGTRITVYDVLNWLANGMSSKDIQKDFPELNEEHVQACLAYAADRNTGSGQLHEIAILVGADHLGIATEKRGNVPFSPDLLYL